MSGYLLDTNCISELVRIKPDPSVMAWMEAAEETLLYLSVLTLGEIRSDWLTSEAGAPARSSKAFAARLKSLPTKWIPWVSLPSMAKAIAAFSGA